MRPLLRKLQFTLHLLQIGGVHEKVHIYFIQSHYFSTDFKYVDQESISPDLICSICNFPLYNPVEHSRCGVEFCESCIDSLADCPSCNNPVTKCRQVTSQRLLNPLSELIVQCPTCTNAVKRSTFLTHYNNCAIGTTPLFLYSQQQLANMVVPSGCPKTKQKLTHLFAPSVMQSATPLMYCALGLEKPVTNTHITLLVPISNYNRSCSLFFKYLVLIKLD